MQLKEFLAVKSEYTDLRPQTDEDLAAAQGRIQELIDLETERHNQAAALNDLESSIYKIRDRMEEDKVQKVTDEAQREAVAADLATAQDWLDEEGWEANTTTLRSKLNKLNGAVKDIFYRVSELTARPKALKRLKASLNSTLQLVDRVRKMNTESIAKNETLWITEWEIDALDLLRNDTIDWLKNKTATQKSMAATENPKLKVSDIKSKTDKLDREQLYLARRPKPRPKKPKAPKKKANATNATNATDETIIDNDNATVTDDTNAGSGDDKPAVDGAGDAPADEPAGNEDAAGDGAAEAEKPADKAESKDEL